MGGALRTNKPTAAMLGEAPPGDGLRGAPGAEATIFRDPGSDEFDVPKHTMLFHDPAGVEDDVERDASGAIRWRLPLLVTVEVFPPDANTECFIIATENKKQWGNGGDGLTVCASVDRTDFDFRYEVFGQFFDRGRRFAHVKLKRGQWNSMALAVHEESAVYFINDRQVHSVEISPRELPTKTPAIGVYGFTTSYRARHFSVRPIRPQVLTMLPVSSKEVAGKGAVSVATIAGKELLTMSQEDLEEMLPLEVYRWVSAELGIRPLITLPGLQTLCLVRRDGSIVEVMSKSSLKFEDL
mmetsp:Transcript_119558/g.283927  ORF Transcript_119558/g.283927 Transcript_119558/m.283927 type:complete len:297 (+) Transcript_119558:36-926(+)|eukprot:CAMPEP_0181442166 /NCGR_PEP_ID=MMETSP1110-20121109/23888_1 /TAXON_ID=174948 /ORGANISM="Symbiodinium sp., Strain CCMP421" /LENGTH=296 /DNA_ID=CAMNT_0023566083 /DNA_START=33 /DNA_END=923 /DNA_ORIENTATION=+